MVADGYDRFLMFKLMGTFNIDQSNFSQVDYAKDVAKQTKKQVRKLLNNFSPEDGKKENLKGAFVPVVGTHSTSLENTFFALEAGSEESATVNSNYRKMKRASMARAFVVYLKEIFNGRPLSENLLWVDN